MTDLAENNVETPKPKRRRSRRGRQVMMLILAVLILLLIGVSFFLVRLVLPSGKIASNPKDAGGLEWVRSIYGWGKAQSQQLIAPGSVAVAADGTIWTTNAANGTVVSFNPDGTYHSTLSAAGTTKYVGPTDLAIDPAGNLYVGENTVNRVLVETPSGQLLRQLNVQTPTAIAASNDRIVVGSNGGFAIFDKEGNVVKVIGQNGFDDGQFDRVNGIVIGSNGTIYVADTYNNRISAYDRQGNRLWITRTGNPANKSKISESTQAKPSVAPANLQLPMQMTIDGSNRLVVVDPFDFTLTVLDLKSGRLIAKYGTFGGEDGKLLYPSGVAYDPGRDWFVVADTTNNRLQIFRVPGSAPDSAAKSFSRLLTGPIRACLFPLLLLLIVLVGAAVNRWRKNRRGKPAVAHPAEAA